MCIYIDGCIAWEQFLTSIGFWFTHRIHGTGIFTYMWLIFIVNVGKLYQATMDPMGYRFNKPVDPLGEGFSSCNGPIFAVGGAGGGARPGGGTAPGFHWRKWRKWGFLQFTKTMHFEGKSQNVELKQKKQQTHKKWWIYRGQCNWLRLIPIALLHVFAYSTFHQLSQISLLIFHMEENTSTSPQALHVATWPPDTDDSCTCPLRSCLCAFEEDSGATGHEGGVWHQ